MTTSTAIAKFLQDNLYSVFAETDPPKRLAAMSRLWVPSSESLFVDPIGLFRSHDAISDLIDTLQKKHPGMVFTELGINSPCT